MPRPPKIIGLAALFLISAPTLAATPGPDRVKELTHFVRQECGFCHGIHLTGGLGSALTATALRDKPAEPLIAATLYGIPGTAMPGWAPFLSAEDASWIVMSLKKGFPQ